jgi:DNA-binding Lrp family transcriptional regulator
MDRLDKRLLELVQRNCRLSIQELAEQVGLSPSACHRRIKLLEDTRIIEGYGARLRRESLGISVQVIVEVSLSSQSREMLESFERAVARMPEILECHLMAGDFDYLLRIAARDAADYERIHRERLTRLPAVARMRSNFVLRTLRDFTGYPVGMA